MPIFNHILLPVYIINLKERSDRLACVLRQFEDKPEFEINIVDAVKHNIGAIGLWHSIRKCVETGIARGDDFIIICEDDHTFTEHYNRDLFIQNILEAHAQGCDVLSGGIGGFNHAVPITANRYWIDHFWFAPNSNPKKSPFSLTFATQIFKLWQQNFQKKHTYIGTN